MIPPASTKSVQRNKLVDPLGGRLLEFRRIAGHVAGPVAKVPRRGPAVSDYIVFKPEGFLLRAIRFVSDTNREPLSRCGSSISSTDGPGGLLSRGLAIRASDVAWLAGCHARRHRGEVKVSRNIWLRAGDAGRRRMPSDRSPNCRRCGASCRRRMPRSRTPPGAGCGGHARLGRRALPETSAGMEQLAAQASGCKRSHPCGEVIVNTRRIDDI